MEPFEPVTNVHGRMDVEITRGRVTPLKAVRIDGDYRGRTTLSGDLLIVALAYGTPRWVQTVADPRKVHEQVQDDAVGVLSEQFPGEFMATKEALSNSDFEFYTTSPTTPLETKVVLENLDVLKQGTTLVGTVHGSDLVPFLYP